jgi:ribose-phosphate pyrophosphokinase
MQDDLKIFSGRSNPVLCEAICRDLGITPSRLEISNFSNDNLYVQIKENVRERDVFVVQSFTQPVSENIMELLIIMDALRSASARRITAVVPYYSYARSDKKDAPRISITGRLIADLLRSAGANRVLTMDLHADSVHGFFSVPVDHLTAIPIISAYFQDKLDLSSTVAVATDAGGAKRVGRFASRLNVPMAIIDKRRISDLDVKQGLVVGDVKGRDAIVFDDEISTGGTIIATVKTLVRAGVRDVYVGATHAVFCGPAVDNLQQAPLKEVIVTDTVDTARPKRVASARILSVASLFSEAIKRIHTGESVGALFT